jgi:hypothetical protein
MTDKKSFQELVYAGKDVETLIKQKWPNAVVKDASDMVHEERFDLEISDITEDDFYPFAISEGFADCCMGFELCVQCGDTKDLDRIRGWIKRCEERYGNFRHHRK